MKKERYIVEIEMPDGDGASSTYICDVIQCDCDVEDEGRWKVSVKECWKPSEEQMERLKGTINSLPHQEVLYSLYQDLKKLREE